MSDNNSQNTSMDTYSEPDNEYVEHDDVSDNDDLNPGMDAYDEDAEEHSIDEDDFDGSDGLPLDDDDELSASNHSRFADLDGSSLDRTPSTLSTKLTHYTTHSVDFDTVESAKAAVDSALNEDEDDDDVEEDDDDEEYLDMTPTNAADSDIAAAKRERATLLKVHAQRQRDIILLWHIYSGSGQQDRKNQLLHLAEVKSCTLHNYEYLQHLYAAGLDTLSSLWTLVTQAREQGDRRIAALTKTLDAKDAKLSRLQSAYQSYVREVAMGAAQAVDGPRAAAAVKQIRGLESIEAQTDIEVHQARLKFLHCKGQVAALESATKRGSRGDDEDGEGGTLNSEQCLTELGTLGETLEDRTAALHKLHRKLSTVGQIHNHVREKLHFIREKNTLLEMELEAIVDDATELRVKLAKEKRLRDGVKRENALLKQQQGFVQSDDLVADFEEKKHELAILTRELQQHKSEYARLIAIATRGQQAQAQVQARADAAATQRRGGGGAGMGGNVTNMRNAVTMAAKSRVPRGPAGFMALSGASMKSKP